MISKEAWVEWTSNDVTKEVFKDVAEGVEAVAADLINRRKSDPIEDSYLRGFIRGVQTLLEWRPETDEVSH